jgi:hypothetical protein
VAAGPYEIWLIATGANQQTGSYTVDIQDPAATTVLDETAPGLTPARALPGLSYRLLAPGERPRFPSALMLPGASGLGPTGPFRLLSKGDGAR